MRSSSCLCFVLLVVMSLVACRKADQNRAEPVAEQRSIAPVDASSVTAIAVAADAADGGAGFDVRAALSSSTAIVIYAVDPRDSQASGGAPAAGEFHGFPIRKSVDVPASEIGAVAAAVREKIGTVSEGDVPACFDPHHGLRLTTPSGTVDLVICFACRQIRVYQGESPGTWETIPRDADTVFVRYLGKTPRHDETWP